MLKFLAIDKAWTMKIVTPKIDHFSSEMEAAYNDYLANSDDTAFFNLTQISQENSYADITGIIYNLDFAKSKNASTIRRMICALFLEQRFIEIVYYYEKYKRYFTRNKEVTRIYTLSRIEAGLLDTEDNMLGKYIALNDDRHHILTIRLAYSLKIGNLKKARLIARRLCLCPECFEHGFVAIIETAILVSDIELLRDTIIKAGSDFIKSGHVNSKIEDIEKLLKRGLLAKIKNIMRTKNEGLPCCKIS